MMGELTKEELEKVHAAFPDATFFICYNISASSGRYGPSADWEQVKQALEKYPIAQWGMKKFGEYYDPIPVIENYPCIRINVMKLTN